MLQLYGLNINLASSLIIVLTHATVYIGVVDLLLVHCACLVALVVVII